MHSLITFVPGSRCSTGPSRLVERARRPRGHLATHRAIGRPVWARLGSICLALSCLGLGCSQILGIDELREGADGGASPPDAAPPPPVDAVELDAPPVQCTDDDQCTGATPVCDLEAGTCRGCNASSECGDSTPFCASDGRCGACVDDEQCDDADRNICDQDELVCRGCAAHDECESLVCDRASALCVDATEIVYADPNGSSATDCGGPDTPCRNLDTAVDAVSGSRRYLRLIGTFNQRLTLSSKTVDVIGDGASLDLTPVDFGDEAGVTVSANARVVIDGLRITNLSVGPGLSCDASEITLRRVTIDRHEGNGVSAGGCQVVINRSSITDNSDLGVAASGDGASLTIERSLIADNFRGGVGSNLDALLIRNNLILRNSNLSEYHGAIRHSGSGPNAFITYNTIVANRVNGNYIGIIQCANAVLSSNIIWANEWPDYTDDDQTIFSCDEVRQNLSDSDLGGAPGNFQGDPLFVAPDDDDYRLLPDSPAVDQGEPDLATLFDYSGNPRPQGQGPDIGALEAPSP